MKRRLTNLYYRRSSWKTRMFVSAMLSLGIVVLYSDIRKRQNKDINKVTVSIGKFKYDTGKDYKSRLDLKDLRDLDRLDPRRDQPKDLQMGRPNDAPDPHLKESGRNMTSGKRQRGDLASNKTGKANHKGPIQEVKTPGDGRSKAVNNGNGNRDSRIETNNQNINGKSKQKDGTKIGNNRRNNGAGKSQNNKNNKTNLNGNANGGIMKQGTGSKKSRNNSLNNNEGNNADIINANKGNGKKQWKQPGKNNIKNEHQKVNKNDKNFNDKPGGQNKQNTDHQNSQKVVGQRDNRGNNKQQQNIGLKKNGNNKEKNPQHENNKFNGKADGAINLIKKQKTHDEISFNIAARERILL